MQPLGLNLALQPGLLPLQLFSAHVCPESAVEEQMGNLARALNPLAATLPKNSLLSPVIATDPKTLFLKSFPCHTSEAPRGGLLSSP